MDNNNSNADSFLGIIFTGMSIVNGCFASIVPNLELWIRLGAGAIAGVSGVMAIRYYHYATQEKKEAIREKQEAIKKLKSE